MTTAIAVTDEMVEAAKAAYMKETGAEAYQLDGWIEPALRAALSAALTPHGEEAAATPAPQQHVRDDATITDFANRLFNLHGFMLCEEYRGKPAVTITFPNLKEAQQFHAALVDLSQHKDRAALASEGQDNG